MSDDTSTVPPAPVPPAPEGTNEEVTLKTPPSLLPDNAKTSDASSEGSSSPAETPEEVPPAPSAPEAPETVTDPAEPVQDPQEGEEETEESDAPAQPVVETTPAGQTVTFPDGRVVHTRSSDNPVSNSEWREFEKTHQGDQLRYPFVPGDKEYTPYSDPNVPNSHLAQQIEREISSFAERVLQDGTAEVSRIWNALHGVHESELDTAIATGGGSDKVMA